MKRGAILLAMAASLIWAPGLAAAKGNTQARGYAVITGPGLSHPIVYSAPWDPSKGGYYSDDAEIFLALANYSGAIPAGKDLIAGGGYVADGVLPLGSAPKDELGPRYRLTWFRDDVIDVAKQDIYPYAGGGLLVYTFPSSRQALIALFGRFQDPAHLWTGWGRATPPYGLLSILQAKGLPRTAPAAGVVQSKGPPSTVTAGAAVRAPRSEPGPALGLSALALLAVLATAAFWFRRRRQRANAVAGIRT